MKPNLKVMSKILRYIPLIFMIILLFPGCKKAPTPAKNYSALVTGKIWTGEFTYTGQPIGYYSIQFNGDSSTVWSDLGGPFSGGKWSLNGKQLILNLTSSIECKGDISDDNTLTNITNSNAFLTLNSGQLNTCGDMVLDGQKWKGSVTNYQGTITTNISITFKPGLKIDIDGGPFPAMIINLPYQRLGASIRFTNSGITFFGVIRPEGTNIKGQTNGGADKYNWQITKQ
ncbi:MAG TPA: hypothetical protein VIJ95_17045 [Hanamia sp.]